LEGFEEALTEIYGIQNVSLSTPPATVNSSISPEIRKASRPRFIPCDPRPNLFDSIRFRIENGTDIRCKWTTGEWKLINPPDIAPWSKGNPQLNGGDRSFRYWPYIIQCYGYVCI